MRDFLLRGLVLLGAATAFLTELLSAIGWLRRAPLAGAWLLMLAAGAFCLYVRRQTFSRVRLRPVEAAIGGVAALVASVVGLTAWLSPPNSADAMAYHMPRVVYWAQAGSVAFFPTPYFNQVSLPPLAEYFMLHTYVLSGGDHFVNLVAFAAFLGSIIGVSALAKELGLESRGQALAALICATLPNGILQASGAKNDWLLSFWLVCAVYFAVRADAPFAGLSAALAMATKSTAYLFLPALLGAAWLDGRLRRQQVAWLRPALWLVGSALVINAPQYIRNLRLSGSPLGYDSAQGDGFFRWRNEHPGLRSTVSNALRHTSEQLGARSPRWNQAVFDAVIQIHRTLGIDPQDPDTTWRWSRYEPPRNANHEANANNRWHLLLLLIAACVAGITRNGRWTLYAGALLAAFGLFCFYLKWQPFLARLELPLFVLGAPLAAWLLERLRPTALAVAICVLLVNNARPALFENWTRPLKGPHSLLATARDENYFSDMGQWNNRSSYLQSVDLTARSGCSLVGLDISENQLEYPFQALLRERNPAVRFLHTGVPGVSARPCAVLCPDCIANQKKIALYQDLGPPREIGRFLLFLPRLQPIR